MQVKLKYGCCGMNTEADVRHITIIGERGKCHRQEGEWTVKQGKWVK